MSLRDTIEGARNEATLSSGKSESESTVKKGATRGSAANAKPSREKAASVRVVSSDGKSKATKQQILAKKTPEQKAAEKAERRKRREEEDYINQAYQLMLNQDPEYKRTERVWWIMLGIGFVCTLISLIISFAFPIADGEYSSTRGIISIGSLIAAYGFIVASFIYDWRKRRPIRKATEAKMAGMSNRKMAKMFAKERQAEIERMAAEEAKKAEKKAKKSGKAAAAADAEKE